MPNRRLDYSWVYSTPRQEWSVRIIFVSCGALLPLQTGAFAGALLVLAVSFISVKEHNAKKRKAELYECK